MTEKFIYYDPGGGTTVLHGQSDTWVVDVTGIGIPDIEHAETQGFSQHGRTWQNFALSNRRISLSIIQQYADRQNLISGAMEFMRLFSPSERAGTLRRVVNDGTYDISVRTGGAFDISYDDSDRRSHQRYVVSFLASDPIWSGGSGTSVGTAIDGAAGFAMPWPNPFGWGQPYEISAISIPGTAVGTWRSYPNLRVYGRMITPNIVLGNGQVKFLDIIDEGEYFDIYASGTGVIVLDDSGGTPRLDVETNALEFYLDHTSDNGITVESSGIGTAGSVEVSYRQKYIGIF